MTEKERLQFCIARFDHYYDSVNNKSAVFLALGTFIVGGILASYSSLHDIANCGFWTDLIIFLIVALGIGNLILIIVAAIPYLSRDKDSLIYFASIHNKGEDQFSSESAACCTEDAHLPDLRKQASVLATGLYKKFQVLQIAGFLFLIKFILSMILLLTIALNIK